MRILLVGASGQVGTALASAFVDAGEIVATAHTHVASPARALNLGDEDQLTSVIEAAAPDLILVSGAMCNVDACELDPDRCRRINTRGPERLAAYARARSASLVFYSTDHVFDGARSRAYREEDETGPLSRYARSKLEAEEAIRRELPDRHLILRTGWVYGPDVQRRNFALRLVERLRAGETVLVPRDQCGCPTYTDDLARVTRWLVDRSYTGTFHATGPDFIDRLSLARAICAAFGETADRLRPCATSELGQAARRSLEVRLSCDKLRATGAPPFRGIDAGLSALAAWAAAGGPPSPGDIAKPRSGEPGRSLGGRQAPRARITGGTA